MIVFNGTSGDDSAVLLLSGFTGGTTAELRDDVGDQFFCFGGHDRVNAGTGNDTIFGGYGDDIFIGRGGFDSMDGGQGHDRMDASWFTGDYNWNLAAQMTPDALRPLGNERSNMAA